MPLELKVAELHMRLLAGKKSFKSKLSNQNGKIHANENFIHYTLSLLKLSAGEESISVGNGKMRIKTMI